MRDASLADVTFKDLSLTDAIYLLASVNVSPAPATLPSRQQNVSMVQIMGLLFTILHSDTLSYE